MIRDDDDYSARPEGEDEDGEAKLGISGKLIEDILLNECYRFQDGADESDLREVAYVIEKALAARGLLR